MVDEELPQELEDVPSTTRQVYQILDEANRPLTRAEIREQVDVTTRTVSAGLARLHACGLISFRPDLRNPGRRLYFLSANSPLEHHH